jgi:hypothetical protein
MVVVVEVVIVVVSLGTTLHAPETPLHTPLSVVRQVMRSAKFGVVVVVEIVVVRVVIVELVTVVLVVAVVLVTVVVV